MILRPSCPVCGSSIADPPSHVSWHTRRDDLDGWRPGALLDELTGSSDAPTISLPPVSESIGPRRRPPAAVVAELLEGAELTRVLLAELAAYDAEDGQL